MLQPTKFEAYSLEELCNNFDLESGSSLFDYLKDDILSCEIGNSAGGMEYSLVYLQSIIDAMCDRFNNYEEDEIEDWETDILNYFDEFMQDKDEQTLVYIQGW